MIIFPFHVGNFWAWEVMQSFHEQSAGRPSKTAKCGSRSPLLDLLDLLNDEWSSILISFMTICCDILRTCLIWFDEFWWFNLQPTMTYSLLSLPVGVLLIPSLNDPTPCEVVGSLVSTRSWDISWRNRRGPCTASRRWRVPWVPASQLVACRGLGDKHCWKWPAGPYLGTWANWGECTWPVICSQGGGMFTQISSCFIQCECFLLHTQIGRVVFLPQMNVL